MQVVDQHGVSFVAQELTKKEKDAARSARYFGRKYWGTVKDGL